MIARAYEYVTPQRVELGASFEKGVRVPMHASCYKCEAKAPMLAGFVGTAPTFGGMGIVNKGTEGRPQFWPMYVCVDCWPAVVGAAKPEGASA